MEYDGVVPTDAPDPSIESEARLRGLDFPVFQLKPQPSLTRAAIVGQMESTGSIGQDELSVLFTYTLWKYPDDRSDPRNEIELDEQTRRSIEEEPPWGRPAWLIEQAQIFRYPMLWEAVRTVRHPRRIANCIHFRNSSWTTSTMFYATASVKSLVFQPARARATIGTPRSPP
jgi:hypothetical protein